MIFSTVFIYGKESFRKNYCINTFFMQINTSLHLRFWMLLTSLIKSGHASDIIKVNKELLHDTILPVLMESDKHQFKKAVDKDEFFNTAIGLFKALKVGVYLDKKLLLIGKCYDDQQSVPFCKTSHVLSLLSSSMKKKEKDRTKSDYM